MLFSLLSGGDLKNMIASLLLSLPVIILALSLHETAHGYVAWKCGDPTAYNLGRLTLNPMKHLDPMGFAFMLIFGYGWAKPVPVNVRYFKNPRRGMALTAIAGPAANLLLGLISAFFYGFFGALSNYVYLNMGNGFLLTVLDFVIILCYLGAVYNFLFMAFNLIPLPPFDGSRVATLFLPERIYFGIMRYERQIMTGILVAMLLISRFTDFSPFSWIAEELTELFFTPVYKIFNKIFLPAEIYNLYF